MLKNEWDTIRGAIGGILFELNKPDDVTLPEPIPRPLNIRELRLYMLGVHFEIEISGALYFTFSALANSADGLARAHRLAASAVVPDPSNVNIKQIEDDLQNVHSAVQADQKFHAGIALAGAVGDILRSLRVKSP